MLVALGIHFLHHEAFCGWAANQDLNDDPITKTRSRRLEACRKLYLVDCRG